MHKMYYNSIILKLLGKSVKCKILQILFNYHDLLANI